MLCLELMETLPPNLLKLNRPGVLQKFGKSEDQEPVIVMIGGNIVVSDDDFAECVADRAQRTGFLFPLGIIGDLIGGLDVIPAMTLIGHEIHFQILPDLASLRIFFVCADLADIHGKPAAAEFIVNDIFHEMVPFDLPEMQKCVSDPDILEIILRRGVNIFASFDIVTDSLADQCQRAFNLAEKQAFSLAG